VTAAIEHASPPTGAPGREATALLGWWVASLGAAVVHNGLWSTPNLAFWSLIAEHPGTNPFTADMPGDYLLTNLSLTFLASWTGQSTPHAYARLHLVVLVVGWAAVLVLAWRRIGYRLARTLTVLVAAAPLVTVSMQWLGQPDPLTGLCGMAMVLVRRRWTVAVLGVVAGLTHPEQAVFMAAIAAAMRPLVLACQDGPDLGGEGDRTWWPSVALDTVAAVGGVLAGRLCTQLVFELSDVVVRTPRTDYLRFGLDGFGAHHGRQPLGLLWTLWGPLWLVLVVLAVRLWSGREDPTQRRDRRLALAAGAAAVLALAPVAVTLDETRVYAVLTAPLLVVLALLSSRLIPERAARWSAAALLVITAALPGGFATGVTSWRGQLASFDMALFLVDGTLPDGSGDDVTGWLMGPFDFVIPELPES
jgi:hypothetical protein